MVNIQINVKSNLQKLVSLVKGLYEKRWHNGNTCTSSGLY